MRYSIDLSKVRKKDIYPLGSDFECTNRYGEKISVNNYYIERNGSPFFAISGEFHFSRMLPHRWEDELIKMKLAGINIVSTYIFWNHHEEIEGQFDFEGRRDVRSFVKLCQKHGMYVILRVGPFCHGEVRNGGLPDWLYGKPFEVRTTDKNFLFYTERLYRQIGNQLKKLFFQDNGPIIGVQIDNEYMHSSAPWEMTTGISNEWVYGGHEGESYMLALKDLAKSCGLNPVFFTCTGWGGASTPESMLPLWGGYAYRPWIFYSFAGEHPATEEYIYQDFHNNDVSCTNDFKPAYEPESRPYACCEMGGGMMCSYYYRFSFPGKSVDAMSNIKLAGGCNFLGYYMFQGGSNPLGKTGVTLNEGQVTKISYDYQAALGEFGQERESYRRLKSIHYFANCFADRLCKLQAVLPTGASDIEPEDLETLRYAVRTDGKSGFLFVNNFQDHREMPDREDERVMLLLSDEKIEFRFSIARDENAILPFHFDMDGIDLILATAQPIVKIKNDNDITYVFMQPEGMESDFVFENESIHIGKLNDKKWADFFTIESKHSKNSADIRTKADIKNDLSSRVNILVLNRRMADNMYVVDNCLIFTAAPLLADGSEIRLEMTKNHEDIYIYPTGSICIDSMEKIPLTINTLDAKAESEYEFLDKYSLFSEEKKIPCSYKQVGPSRYTISIPANSLEGIKDARIQIDYHGDIGYAFIDGQLVHDNFYNGETWEIGLSDIAERLKGRALTIYINPLKKGVKVNVESAMAARIEEVDEFYAGLDAVHIQPVWEINL